MECGGRSASSSPSFRIEGRRSFSPSASEGDHGPDDHPMDIDSYWRSPTPDRTSPPRRPGDVSRVRSPTPVPALEDKNEALEDGSTFTAMASPQRAKSVSRVRSPTPVATLENKNEILEDRSIVTPKDSPPRAKSVSRTRIATAVTILVEKSKSLGDSGTSTPKDLSTKASTPQDTGLNSPVSHSGYPLTSPLSSLSPERIEPTPPKKSRITSSGNQIDDTNRSLRAASQSRPRRSTQRVSYVEPFALGGSEEDSVDEGDISDVSAFTASVAETETDEEPDSGSEVATLDGSTGSVTDVEPQEDLEEDAVTKPRTSRPKKTAKSAGSVKIPPANKTLDLNLPPLSNIEDIFADMASRALKLGLGDALEDLHNRPINVATMCSGTESPLIALQLLSKALEKDGQKPITYKHHFSAEIDAMKQGFIERNFHPQILFRDVREFIPEDAKTAITAYGAEEPIPGKLDMLIAGFVCKDLSRMNTRPKGLDEGGESADTWWAVYSYADRFRPSVVLIENVQHTRLFWDEVKKLWAKIGYECSWHWQDTKNHYLPQTRQRMYMIALDRKLYGKGADKATELWRETMAKLQRQCSSPFEAFVVDDYIDPSAYTARTSEVEWALCKLRYDRIRAEEQLGTKRPVSQWSENGSVRPPDWANKKWYQSQSTRVYDAIDIAHMQGAAAGYDSMYKMIIWDVSQNVDRFKAGLGITPCITPSGISFVTNKQTPLTGTQLLLLQGMPNDKLLFGRETFKDRQDLAGNAMSTTVIGASIVAALMSARRSFRQLGPEQMLTSEPTKTIAFVTPGHMPCATIKTPVIENMNLGELGQDSTHSSRLCNCEGTKYLSKSAIQICNQCGHIACAACAGNPQHGYKDSIPRESRVRPTNFERKWRPKLPSQLSISSLLGLWELLAHVDVGSKLRKQMSKSSEPFCISQFYRLENYWKVTYLSAQSRLELVVGHQIHYDLYIHCPPTEPGNSSLRKTLEQPLARGTVKESLLQPHWEKFVPEAQSVTLTLTASSKRYSSWRNRLGLLEFKSETIPASIEVKSDQAKSLSGSYILLPHCGTPMSSLYKRTGDNPIYLFLESNPIGNGHLDAFVFSTDCRRKGYGEARVVEARVDHTWRPWMLNGVANVEATLPGRWESADLTLSTVKSGVQVLVPRSSSVSDAALAQKTSDCDYAIKILEVAVPGHIDTKDFSTYSWALEQAKLKPSFFHSWNTCAQTAAACSCAPPLPRTLWNVDEEGNARACEDRLSAAVFERKLKTRPKIFDIRAITEPRYTRIAVGFNIASLIHRARSRLPGCKADKTAWRLITDHVESAWEPFEEFYLQSNTDDLPYAGPLRLQFSLAEAQKRSLSWMRNQEKGVPLHITEVEEEIHPGLGWRAEARAEQLVKICGGVLADLPSFGKTVTSIGLIESEFAESEPEDLFKLNSKQKAGLPELIELAATLIVCPHHISKQWNDEFKSFLGERLYEEYNILLIETFEQLQELVIEDLQASRVIIISWSVFADERYIAQLAKFAAVPEPANTKGRAYDAWLDYVAGQIPGRLTELILEGPSRFESKTESTLEARLDMPDFKAIVPLKVLHGSAYQSYKEMLEKTKEPKAPVAKRESKFKGERHDSTATWTQYQSPVLEMFRFNRIVVDEYHYLFNIKENYAACSALKKIPSHKRWLLSGTPALTSFSDINQIASLLGTTLGRDVFGPSPTKLEQKIIDEQTDVENFLSRTESRSYEWHQARHQRGQDFLNRFVRQNKPELDHIPCTEELRAVELSMDHFIIYLELLQHLVAQYMNVKRLKANDNSDRTRRLHESLEGSDTAEEALLKSALCFREKGGLDSILRKREEQKKQTMREITEAACRAERSLKTVGQTDDHYIGFKRDYELKGNPIGDKEASAIVLKRLLKAKAQSSTAKSLEKKKLSTLEWKKLTSDLGKLAKDLLVNVRSLRFVQNTTKLLPAFIDGSAAHQTHKCDSADCAGSSTVSQLFIVSDCGHLACQACLDKRENTESCVDSHCDVFTRGKNLIHVPSLYSGATEATSSDSFGAKLDAIADLIKQLPHEDQAIIFVPNDETTVPVEELLATHDITFSSVRGSRRSAARIIEEFKTEKDPQQWDKILILNLEDESSSGL